MVFFIFPLSPYLCIYITFLSYFNLMQKAIMIPKTTYALQDLLAVGLQFLISGIDTKERFKQKDDTTSLTRTRVTIPFEQLKQNFHVE